MRVAFTPIGGTHWLGGHNYLLNLLGCLRRWEARRIEPVLFAGDDLDQALLEDFRAIDGLEIVTSPVFLQGRRSIRLAQSLLLGRDRAAGAVFSKHDIDAIFEVGHFYGSRIGLPAVSWIPDFQHKDLPDLFGKASVWKRDFGYRAQINAGRTIMLSSRSASESAQRHYDIPESQIAVVPFAVPMPEAATEVSSADLREAYGVDGDYFFMPNHFWQHKNHQVVVQALDILRRRGDDETIVVSTGGFGDYRNQGYASFVRSEISRLALDQNFRVLGTIPYAHVRSLLQRSRGLLNPSLYEGWSTTVEEAKSIGAPMLLSDLPVHIEQATSRAVFFDRRDPRSLADAMADFAVEWNDDTGQLRKQADEATATYARRFADLFEAKSNFNDGRTE